MLPTVDFKTVKVSVIYELAITRCSNLIKMDLLRCFPKKLIQITEIPGKILNGMSSVSFGLSYDWIPFLWYDMVTDYYYSTTKNEIF